ncbi:MAG TPA: ParB N-terminal domain-containing protein [Candidatus Dojkabacteria bacterium]|nr:ParB N-terminal domain-containing protein [Candidatus Dojkabacteria bacterium]
MEREISYEYIKWEHTYIPIEDISPVENIRPIDYEIVEEIASSIPVTGQLQACIADVSEDGIRLLAGRHRYEAIKLLNDRGFEIGILVKLANRTLSDEEVLSIQMSENLHNKMTSAQEATIIHGFWNRMVEIYGKENISISMIASKMGRSPRKVSDAVKYIENISPKVQEMVDSGHLAYSSALLLSGLKTTDDGWGEQIRTALQIVSRDLNSKEAKKYIDRLNQESEFAGPLFNNEMWENIKKNGHIISIKTEADKEGKNAAGWFVRMLNVISKLDEPDRIQLSKGIVKAINELDLSLDDFIKKLCEYNPKNSKVIHTQMIELIERV